MVEKLCSGEGVAVNISALSKSLDKHRNTIKDRVEKLFEYNILDRPVFPYNYLGREYPLIAIVREDFPRDEKTDEFILYDEHIFAAFFVREEEYNTLTIEFHKDIYSYSIWRENLIKEGKVPPRATRYPSHTTFFSTKLIIKCQPHSSLYTMEEKLREKGLAINGYKFDELSFRLMKKLTLGEGIRTNENLLASTLGMQRRTVERRILKLLDDGVIGSPICRFPRFFVPPNYVMVLSLREIRRLEDKVIKAIIADPSIPIAIKACTGRYNLLVVGAFPKIEDHIRWEEEYNQRFPDCIGAARTTYLSPETMFSINPQYVSLCDIKRKIAELHGKALRESL